MRKLLMATTAAISLIAGLASAQTFNEYPAPSSNAAPYGITTGPSNTIWFTENGFVSIGGHGPDQIGRLANSCPNSTSFCPVITEFPIPTVGAAADGIVQGSDGNLWFTETLGNKIAKITPTGVVTEFPLSTAGSNPKSIVSGPDGALWFTECGTYPSAVSKIGRITTLGVITEYATPTTPSCPTGITVGEDGALWFTEQWNNGGSPAYVSNIGRITTSGSITEYALPFNQSFPNFITSAPDGALWFTENQGKIGRITTNGVVTAEYPTFTTTLGGNPLSITVGPDGVLWFTAGNGLGNLSWIGRMDLNGSIIVQYVAPSNSSTPFGIVLGTGGSLFITETLPPGASPPNPGQIGRLKP